MSNKSEIDAARPNGPFAPEEDPNIRIIMWHTNSMLFVTLVLLPSGMFVSRYLKETWTYRITGRPIWLLAHIVYMITAFLIAVYGIYLAMAYERPVKRETTSSELIHGIIGWVTLVLIAIQILSGWFLPSKKVKLIYHRILRMIHWFIGGSTNVILLLLAMVSGLLADAQYPYFSSIVILVWIIFALAMHVLYAWYMHESDKHVLSLEEDGFKNYYRLFLPLPIPILLEDVPLHKFHAPDFRLLMWLWFQFGGCAAFCIIFLANSEGYGEYHCKEWSVFQVTCSNFVPHIRY